MQTRRTEEQVSFSAMENNLHSPLHEAAKDMTLQAADCDDASLGWVKIGANPTSMPADRT